MPNSSSARRQGIFWLGTVPWHLFSPPFLPPGVTWLKCQLESGSETGFVHWQIALAFASKQSLVKCTSLFTSQSHWELSRSSAASAYVHKDDTAIPGTRYEFGSCPIARNSKHDWDRIWESARDGHLERIPSSVRFQSYRTIKSIMSDFVKPVGIERSVSVYWGDTGTGKSRRAWGEAGANAYPKDPRTKFWDGYSGEEFVVIDELRTGCFDVANFLRWFDRYPVRVEIKGGATVLRATRVWITSNLPPNEWWPDLDCVTLAAVNRRITEVVHFINPFP